jgi:hypothetical protein
MFPTTSPRAQLAQEKNSNMELPDRCPLFEIIDEEGENLFVAASNYVDAIAKYKEWVNDPEYDDVHSIELVRRAGWLIKQPSTVSQDVLIAEQQEMARD